jgi:hypothetical protein
MTRTNKYNTRINTNYGEVGVEFDVIWSMENHSWSVANVDLIDYDDESIPYDHIRSRVLEIAYTDCDPFGGIHEDSDYAD